MAYVRKASKWYYCSDAGVGPASERNVLAAEAYLLFYERE
jgi:ubiquitin C-terminal hydrolase